MKMSEIKPDSFFVQELHWVSTDIFRKSKDGTVIVLSQKNVWQILEGFESSAIPVVKINVSKERKSFFSVMEGYLE